jgi:multiple sugar transport system permease protein
MKVSRWTSWMLAPGIGFLVCVFVGPFVYMVWVSLTDLSFSIAEHRGSFIGFSNYVQALAHDGMFWNSVARSAVFSMLCVIPSVLLAIVLAEMLHWRPLAQRLLSPLFAFPVLLPSVVVGLYWRVLLQGEFGVISYYLDQLGLPGAKSILSHSKTILYTLALVDTWQWGPFVALMLLAARRSLPRFPLEAAWMDGAGRWRAFYDVTLPALLPTVFIVALIRAIDSFKEFDKVYIITGGGPGTASELSSLYIWRVAFRQWNFGYGAALCVVVYCLIYAFSRIGAGQVRAGRRS